MTKFMKLVFSNGEVYEIPVILIASSRATYYAGVDCGKDKSLKFEDVYKRELDYTIKNEEEIFDWASNNMNWADVKGGAVKVPSGKTTVNYQDEWINNEEREIVDHD